MMSNIDWSKFSKKIQEKIIEEIDIKQKWQAKIEDFETGEIKTILAVSHPIELVLKVNIFTKEICFAVSDIQFDKFEDALEYFNELV